MLLMSHNHGTKPKWVGVTGKSGTLFIYKAVLVLFRPQADRQKTTIYNYGLPQDSRHFYKMPRDLPLRRASGCMGGDLSAIVASASRRPRTSMCLVKVGSRPVQIATPAFQSNPGLPRFPPRSSGVLSTIFDKIVGHLTLSPQGPRPRSKPNLVEFTVIKVKRNLPSMSFYESHRRQPSITRSARLNK